MLRKEVSRECVDAKLHSENENLALLSLGFLLLVFVFLYSYQCCGSGSNFDQYFLTLWIRILIPNTGRDPHH